MKKLLTLVLAFSLAFVLSNMSFAQDAEQAAPLTIENEVDVDENAADATPCGYAMPYGRRACMPCYANPCRPCPPRPICAPCPRPLCRPACPPMGDPCGYPGYGYGDCCGYGNGYGYGYGYGCGYPGTGFYRTPVRNFLSRLFAPRPYCGYDAMYGPYGDCCY